MAGDVRRELATTLALEALPSGAWRELHEVRFESRRLATVDHLVVGRGGVFVIDSRDWSGEVEVGPEGLLQNGETHESTPVRLADAAAAVAEQVSDLDPRHVVPVLCFDRDESWSGWVGDVLVCTTANVVDLLVTQSRVLAQEQVDDVFNRLTWLLPVTSYQVGTPSGPSRSGHRREGRVRPALPSPRRSSARHASSAGETQSLAIRAGFTAAIGGAVVCVLTRYFAGPASDWTVAMVASLH